MQLLLLCNDALCDKISVTDVITGGISARAKRKDVEIINISDATAYVYIGYDLGFLCKNDKVTVPPKSTSNKIERGACGIKVVRADMIKENGEKKAAQEMHAPASKTIWRGWQFRIEKSGKEYKIVNTA